MLLALDQDDSGTELGLRPISHQAWNKIVTLFILFLLYVKIEYTGKSITFLSLCVDFCEAKVPQMWYFLLGCFEITAFIYFLEQKRHVFICKTEDSVVVRNKKTNFGVSLKPC